MIGGNSGSSVARSVFAFLLTYGLPVVTTAICGINCSECNADICTECYYGFWGSRCHLRCKNCWLAKCEKDSGRCIHCEPGRYRNHCDTPCPKSCRPLQHLETIHCNRHTGRCQEGCLSGWWGEQCQYLCNSGCQGNCFQNDGACIYDCRKGLFGRHCNKTCSEGCSEGSCDWLTGNCHGGCKCGYERETCKDICSADCNTPCKMDNETGCLLCKNICSNGKCLHDKCHQNGSCIEGCQDGFYGEHCRHKCNPQCKTCDTRICSACPKRKKELFCTDPVVVNEETNTEANDPSNEFDESHNLQTVFGGASARSATIFLTTIPMALSLDI